jgi:hypothetical protein
LGRLTPTLRQTRADARAWARTVILCRAAARYPDMRNAAFAAREAGRSCYFRPLFDRPRHWAAQRTPRSVPLAAK